MEWAGGKGSSRGSLERTCGYLFHHYHLETSGALAKQWAGIHSEVPALCVFTKRLNQPSALHPTSWSGWVAKGLRGARWERTCESLRQRYRLATSAALANQCPGDPSELPDHCIFAKQRLLPDAPLRTLVGWRGSNGNCAAPLEHTRIALPHP